MMMTQDDRATDTHLPHKIPFMRPGVILATWFGCGLLKPAPGSWGTLGALPFGIFILVCGGWPYLLIGIALITAIGLWAAKDYERRSGTHDSSSIVIDEVAGMWIALLPAALDPLSVFIAFILFRAFDILKPGPIGWVDKKLPGAPGVMADDILAGLCAAAVLFGIQYYAHHYAHIG
jgi:phosphatidylglycerophosphatase A